MTESTETWVMVIGKDARQTPKEKYSWKLSIYPRHQIAIVEHALTINKPNLWLETKGYTGRSSTASSKDEVEIRRFGLFFQTLRAVHSSNPKPNTLEAATMATLVLVDTIELRPDTAIGAMTLQPISILAMTALM